MLFTSLNYPIFLLTVIFLYSLLNKKYLWILLLAGSYLFYMAWKPAYIFLIILSTLSVYFSALLIERTAITKDRKLYFISALLFNLGMLFIFKYFNFFAFSFASIFPGLKEASATPALKILLPVGISFYIFQSLGYIIDVYKKRLPAEKHLGYFALFISFFPQLVAGPIERSSNLLPQLKRLSGKITYEDASSGLKLILFGMFKKVVIADNLAFLVNEVYNQPSGFSGFHFAIATLLFAFQIYADFSGYTDIALGSARILGIKLMENFRKPYFASSLSDFWRRWHISMSTWFRDYLFIPLAFHFSNKFPKAKYAGIKAEFLIYILAIIITFALTGLWHGANWTFLLWGWSFAFMLILEYASRKLRKKLIQRNKFFAWISVPLTFSLVTLSFVFFRANNVHEALIIFEKLFTSWHDISFNISDKMNYVWSGIFGAILLFIIELFSGTKTFPDILQNRPRLLRWVFYYFLVAMILLTGYFGEVEFIYFQF